MLRRVRIVVGLLGVLVAAAVGIVVNELRPLDPSQKARTVTILPGASSFEIGDLLASAGLIRYSIDFVIMARLRGQTRSLHEGEYRLSPAMGLLEIGDVIARGAVIEHAVTIPEGYTAAEIVEVLVREGLGDRDRLLAVVHNGARLFEYDFLRALPTSSLEGYLYPDTYRIPRHLPPQKVIGLFLDRFAQIVHSRWRAQQGAGYSLHEVITIASLVEREARVPVERSLIAGVLYNRLRRGWRLEVDATVLYALGRHKAVVTYEDLKVASPYNTYLYPGLPPGPIANPGLAAIEAGLVPAQTDYLFYVARPDGSHVFSKTFQEHLAAIQRYRKQP